MPELPEVETIAQGLRPLLTHRTITGIPHLAPHLVRQGQTSLTEKLIGQQIQDVSRRGKLLFLDLSPTERIAFHLRMTGRLGMAPAGQLPAAHVHLLINLDNQSALYFQDQRKFGTCRHFTEQELNAWPFYSRMGPEPLSIGAEEFSERLAGKRGRIKALLLNQEVIAGIGNIYADESLFRAAIHPATPAAALSRSRITKLHHAMQDVLRDAITAGGSSIRDYRTAAGLVGTFQNAFQVYGRKHQPCLRCAEALRITKVAGRTTCYCPGCQPEIEAG
ncbi:bifunctional DNA-formamidopyrimidine glycosylase/DNA-(apurinic or apyrimidinic site) lyase [Desulfonatronum parangueonense]